MKIKEIVWQENIYINILDFKKGQKQDDWLTKINELPADNLLKKKVLEFYIKYAAPDRPCSWAGPAGAQCAGRPRPLSRCALVRVRDCRRAGRCAGAVLASSRLARRGRARARARVSEAGESMRGWAGWCGCVGATCAYNVCVCACVRACVRVRGVWCVRWYGTRRGGGSGA